MNGQLGRWIATLCGCFAASSALAAQTLESVSQDIALVRTALPALVRFSIASAADFSTIRSEAVLQLSYSHALHQDADRAIRLLRSESWAGTDGFEASELIALEAARQRGNVGEAVRLCFALASGKTRNPPEGWTDRCGLVFLAASRGEDESFGFDELVTLEQLRTFAFGIAAGAPPPARVRAAILLSGAFRNFNAEAEGREFLERTIRGVPSDCPGLDRGYLMLSLHEVALGHNDFAMEILRRLAGDLSTSALVREPLTVSDAVKSWAAISLGRIYFARERFSVSESWYRTAVRLMEDKGVLLAQVPQIRSEVARALCAQDKAEKCASALGGLRDGPGSLALFREMSSTPEIRSAIQAKLMMLLGAAEADAAAVSRHARGVPKDVPGLLATIKSMKPFLEKYRNAEVRSTDNQESQAGILTALGDVVLAADSQARMSERNLSSALLPFAVLGDERLFLRETAVFTALKEYRTRLESASKALDEISTGFQKSDLLSREIIAHQKILRERIGALADRVAEATFGRSVSLDRDAMPPREDPLVYLRSTEALASGNRARLAAGIFLLRSSPGVDARKRQLVGLNRELAALQRERESKFVPLVQARFRSSQLNLRLKANLESVRILRSTYAELASSFRRNWPEISSAQHLKVYQSHQGILEAERHREILRAWSDLDAAWAVLESASAELNGIVERRRQGIEGQVNSVRRIAADLAEETWNSEPGVREELGVAVERLIGLLAGKISAHRERIRLVIAEAHLDGARANSELLSLKEKARKEKEAWLSAWEMSVASGLGR